MSELAAAIHDIKIGVEGSTTTMRDALQYYFGFPIELVGLAYIPSDNVVRVHIRPQNDPTVKISSIQPHVSWLAVGNLSFAVWGGL